MSEPKAARPTGRLAAIALAAVVLLVGLQVARSRTVPRFASFEGEAMATLWQVTIPEGGDRAEAARIADECFARFAELDLELSEWKEGSPLAAVNRAAGVAPVAVPEELFDLVERSIEIGRATEGAFDVSWAALWGLWDFRATTPVLPAAEAVASRRTLVDYRKIVLDREHRTIYLPEAGMKLGLGGIAKGYALAEAGKILRAHGIDSFLVVSGGQVFAQGTRAGSPWRVGVRDPRGERDEIFATLPLAGGSLSTSADNESFFLLDGERYHHILDPRTGWPSRGLRSATVLAGDPTLADALSTAVMVLGRERGLAVASRLGAGALVVDDAGDIAMTPEVAEIVTVLQSPRRDS